MTTIDLAQPRAADLRVAFWRGAVFAEALRARTTAGDPAPWPSAPVLRFRGVLDVPAVLDESGSVAAWVIDPAVLARVPDSTPVLLLQLGPSGVTERVYGRGFVEILGDVSDE